MAKSRSKSKKPAPSAKRKTTSKPQHAAKTRDSKQTRLIAMLRSPEGATIATMAKTFGWQPHTVRGVLAGALKKKLGLTISSEKVEGGARVYRIL
jgi:hypothetical protein